jgi:hypothetical protein
MSVKNPENINNNDDSLVDANGSYEESYDDIDSSEQVSDEWEDDNLSDTEDEKPQDSPKKKKSKSFLFIILGVIFIAILGFVFLAGGDESVNQQVVAEDPVSMSPDVANGNNIQQQEQPVIIADTQVVPESKPEPVVEQTGILDDQDVVNKVENSISENPITEPSQIQSSVQAPSEASSGQDIKVSNDNSAVTQQNGNDIVSVVTPDIKSVSDFPTIDSIKKADNVEVVTPADIPDIKETSPVNVAETGIDKPIFEEKLKAAEARIADLEKMLSDKEIELNEQKSALSIKANNEEVETLKSKIIELENKLSNVSNDSQSTETKAPTQSNIKKSDKVAESVNESATQNKSLINTHPVKQKPIWILRSANSTKAVIYNKVSGDLKTVVVGDTVEGLGRIQSISEQNSLWVIKASKSSLSE